MNLGDPTETSRLSDGPEFSSLRAKRRSRIFEAMGRADVDVLILGRPAEVTYATGVRQLWLAGSRPFGPSAIAVAATGRIHLLATSQDGVPEELGGDDLFAMSWNPSKVRAAVAALPGVADARVVGTTSFVPGFDRFVRSVAPHSVLVDGAPVLDEARRTKLPEEISCITNATALATDAQEAMMAAAQPGITERELLATYLGRLGALGVPTPPTEGVASVIGPGPAPRLRRIATDRRLIEGDRVALDVSADAAGYEGGVGTTVVVSATGGIVPADEPLAGRAMAMLDALVAACRPGVSGAALRDAATSTGERLPVEPFVTGMGIGIEPPVVTAGIGVGVCLERDMVLSVSAWVTESESGGWFERRLVVVGDPPSVIVPHG